MADVPTTRRPDGSGGLSALRESVTEARQRVDQARGARSTPTAPSGAGEQRDLWHALELYAGALEHLGVPVPYRMRDELSLYRSLFAIRRGT